SAQCVSGLFVPQVNKGCAVEYVGNLRPFHLLKTKRNTARTISHRRYLRTMTRRDDKRSCGRVVHVTTSKFIFLVHRQFPPAENPPTDSARTKRLAFFGADRLV